jgi:hypothetical protein
LFAHRNHDFSDMPSLSHVPESLGKARHWEDSMRQRAKRLLGDMLRQFAEQCPNEGGFFREKPAQVDSEK